MYTHVGLPASALVSRSAPNPHEWSSLVGIITAIVGNILISFALNIQRYAHIRIDRDYKDKHDKHAKQARKHLPKSLRGYGTAVQQEEVAEERARINAEAPGLGLKPDADEPDSPESSHVRRESDETLRQKEEEDNEESGRQNYLSSPWWWLGIVLMTVGEAGNFLAYGFAPASIVSPLGVVALISNCLIAPLMLKESFRKRDFWGVIIAIGGAVTVVLSASTSEKKLGPDQLLTDIKRWEFLVYVLITIVAIGALMFLSPRYGRRTILIDLGLVGLFGGYTVLSTKGVASLLSLSLYKAFTFPITYVLILVLVLSAIMQIRYLNRALMNFNSTQVIPVQFVLFTLSVIIGSAVLYRDFERTTTDQAIKFIVGCLLTFSGVYFITSGRKQGDEEDEDDDFTHEETIRLIDEESNLESTDRPYKDEQHLGVDTNNTDGFSTPRRLSKASIPSIAVTPSTEPDSNPKDLSTESLVRTTSTPQTPQYNRSSSDAVTPFFTPQTSTRGQLQNQRFRRTPSSPANPETPSKRGPSPPKADSNNNLSLVRTTSKRGSISRLMPGPLLAPLSSSLSAVVADSLLRGEGSPQSIRASLRRNRSSRSAFYRNDPDPDSESNYAVESPFPQTGSTSRELRYHDDIDEEEESSSHNKRSKSVTTDTEDTPLDSRPNKGRLRSMSESLTMYMDKKRGKPVDKDRHRDREDSKDKGKANDSGDAT